MWTDNQIAGERGINSRSTFDCISGVVLIAFIYQARICV